MTLALNKYEMLKKQDAWNAKSIEQEQIVTLSAELQKIKDANLKHWCEEHMAWVAHLPEKCEVK
jgi:hypothetical protein